MYDRKCVFVLGRLHQARSSAHALVSSMVMNAGGHGKSRDAGDTGHADVCWSIITV
jgi:hypothetical protein